MEQYFYSICGLPIRVDSDIAIEEDPFRKRFAVPPCAPKLTLHITRTDGFQHDGALISETDTDLIFEKAAEILYCQRVSPKAAPYSVTVYRREAPAAAMTQITSEACAFATDERYFWRTLALPQLLPHFGAILMHASMIACGDSAILFSAPSGTGKSTQAALWEQHCGAEIVNGDKAGIALSANGFLACGVPFAGSSNICKKRDLPLKALVFLAQAAENSVTRLQGRAALQAVMENMYYVRSSAAETHMLLDLLIQLTTQIPVFYLQCTPDLRAVSALQAALK